MNQVWNYLDFLHAVNHQRFPQDVTNIFGRLGQTCQDRQSNCKIHKRDISLKQFYGLPCMTFYIHEDLLHTY